MIVSHRHRFIFLKTQKTASTSLEVFLRRFCGPRDIVTPITPIDEKVAVTAGMPPRNFATDPALEKAYVACIEQGRMDEAFAIHGIPSRSRTTCALGPCAIAWGRSFWRTTSSSRSSVTRMIGRSAGPASN